MDNRIEKYLIDIENCIHNINYYTKGLTQKDYIFDQKTKHAVERNFEIIGEALNKIGQVDRSILKQIREYRKIISFRNQLIHGYDMISDPITWDIIKHKLPLLQEDIQQLKKQ